MSQKDCKFAIQFSGKDIPGLLHAWSEPLATRGYNITGVNLATGGSAHTTFLTCEWKPKTEKNRGEVNQSEGQAGVEPAQKPENEKKVEVRNPNRKRLEIEKELSERVRILYKKYNEKQDLADALDEPVVRVTPAHPEDRDPSFQIYLILQFDDVPGALAHLTDILRGTYTINSSFDRPVWPKNDQQEPSKRMIYINAEYFNPKTAVRPSVPLVDPPSDENLGRCENIRRKAEELDKVLRVRDKVLAVVAPTDDVEKAVNHAFKLLDIDKGAMETALKAWYAAQKGEGEEKKAAVKRICEALKITENDGARLLELSQAGEGDLRLLARLLVESAATAVINSLVDAGKNWRVPGNTFKEAFDAWLHRADLVWDRKRIKEFPPSESKNAQQGDSSATPTAEAAAMQK